jgi:hypothetical protein
MSKIMPKSSFSITTLSILLAGGLVSSANAVPQDFVGTWVNTNQNTGGITRLVVTPSGSALRIQVFGKCHPTDCDWGTTTLLTYGRTVQDSDHIGATATYNKGFSNTFLTFLLGGSGRTQINLQSFTQFTDNSGRQNYFAQEIFRKAGLTAPIQLSPPDGAVFNNYPRTTTLQWSPVTGAVSYTVEVDCFHCCQNNQWCSDVGGQTRIASNLTQTNYTFDFVGAQPGRWRVWAVDANGNAGPKSNWRTFRYTR